LQVIGKTTLNLLRWNPLEVRQEYFIGRRPIALEASDVIDGYRGVTKTIPLVVVRGNDLASIFTFPPDDDELWFALLRIIDRLV